MSKEGWERVPSSIIPKTEAYTATAMDKLILCDATGGGFTVTLPAASGIVGREYIIKKIDSSANSVKVDGNGSETLDGVTDVDLYDQYELVKVMCDGSNWHIL